MTTRENMIQDYDAVLDARYGKEGTPERLKFEDDAYAYYTGLILRDARKNAKVSQAELAKRTNTTKSYISRIENGVIIGSGKHEELMENCAAYKEISDSQMGGAFLD